MIFQIHPNLDVLETLQTVSPIWGFSETKMMRHHHFHYWDCHFLIVVAAFSATNAPIYRLPQLPHVHMCLQCTVDVSAVPKTSLSCRGLGDHGDPPNEGFNFFNHWRSWMMSIGICVRTKKSGWCPWFPRKRCQWFTLMAQDMGLRDRFFMSSK